MGIVYNIETLEIHCNCHHLALFLTVCIELVMITEYLIVINNVLVSLLVKKYLQMLVHN